MSLESGESGDELNTGFQNVANKELTAYSSNFHTLWISMEFPLQMASDRTEYL